MIGDGGQEAVSFFSSYTNGKWGVINSLGEVVIEHIYDEMVIVPNRSEPVFIVIYDVNEERGTYRSKVIDDSGRELITGFDSVSAIDNFDSRQNLWFEDNVLRVRKNGQYGLVDFEGETLLPYEYDEIQALRGITSNFVVRQGGQVGLVNENGQFIIPALYAEILLLREGDRHAYVVVDSYGNRGLISISGTVLIEPQYEAIIYVYSREIYAVRYAGQYKLINLSGEIVLEGNYDSFAHIRGENIIASRNGRYGIVNRDDEIIVPFTSERIRFAFGENYIARRDGKYGIINLQNEVMLDFIYVTMNYIEAGSFIKADINELESAIIDNDFITRITRNSFRIKYPRCIFKSIC